MLNGLSDRALLGVAVMSTICCAGAIYAFISVNALF